MEAHGFAAACRRPNNTRNSKKPGNSPQAGAPEKIQIENGKGDVKLKLARQAVSLLVLEWN